jgi:DNA-directed RNA polymerase specialized sigma24 family protein
MNISSNPLASVREGTIEDQAMFNAHFLRCRKLLVFIASCVLGGSEGTDEALQNCWFTASRNPPRFEHEGAFRSWLVRVLIDEALAILREAQETETDRPRRTDS